MTNILSVEKFHEQLEPLIDKFLLQYSKETYNDYLAVTQGLYNIFLVAVERARERLDPLLQKIMDQLFPILVKPIDVSGAPNSLKNNHEMHRCFEMLATGYVDRVLQFVLLKLDERERDQRYGSLSLMKHFVTRMRIFYLWY